MTLFLGERWLDLMIDVGNVSAKRAMTLGGQTLFVGEARAYGQKTWLLYGAWRDPDGAGLRELFATARRERVARVVCDFNMSRWPDAAPLHALGTTTRPFATSLLDLDQSEERLWQGLHGKHRNMVRRAQREGVAVTPGLDPVAFHELLDATYARGGGKNRFSRTYLERLIDRLGENLITLSASHGGQLQAAACIPFDRERGYYLHGAARADGIPGAATLLHWEIIRLLRARGVAAYDLGGVRPETADPRLRGIFQFKQRFGGVLEPCWLWEKTTHPAAHLLGRLTRRGYALLGLS